MEFLVQDLSDIVRSQLHYVFLWNDIVSAQTDATVSSRLVELQARIGDSCRKCFEGHDATPSHLQEDVQSTVESLGYECEAEARDAVTGYSIDILVKGGGVKGTAVEVDGPSHFIQHSTKREPNGPTKFKRKALEKAGYRVVSVPFWEWNSCAGREERKRYIAGVLTQGQC